MPQSITRRCFLGATLATGALCASKLYTPWALAASRGDWPKLPPVRIYKVYAGRTGDLYLARPTEELARLEQYLALYDTNARRGTDMHRRPGECPARPGQPSGKDSRAWRERDLHPYAA